MKKIRLKVRIDSYIIHDGLFFYIQLFRHQAREAEPKDYDLKDYDPEKRKLHNSTYKRILNVTDGVSLLLLL
jgi:hypothetical protein